LHESSIEGVWDIPWADARSKDYRDHIRRRGNPSSSVPEPGVALRSGSPPSASRPAHRRESADGRIRRTGGLRIVPVVVSLILFAIGSYLIYRPLGVVSTHQLPTCACNDLVEQTWFTAWPSYAITHLHNPFFTTKLNYPIGVNLLDNTSMPLLGTLVTPITLIAGPVASYTLLLHLAFFASATSCFFVVRRFVTHTLPAFFAGALYGFSPYMVGQGAGHLQFTFVPLPPLIFWLTWDLLVSRRLRWRRAGVLLAACLVGQFFISTEILASTGIVVGAFVVATIVYRLARGRPRDRNMLGHALRGMAVAAVITGVVLCYPAWFIVAGPQHISGPAQPLAALNPLKSDLLSPLVPTFHQAVGPEALRARGSSYVAGRITENGGYLGVLLIVALVVVVVVARKNRIVQISAALGFFAFVLSLGSPLVVNGHSTNIPLPFAALEHLPLIQSLVASRFSLYVVFFASLIFGVGINRLMSSRARHLGFTATSARAAAAIGLSVLVLVPLFPEANYGVGNVNVPPYLVSEAGTSDIPDGSAVLTYPFPLDPVDQAMLWRVGFQHVGVGIERAIAHANQFFIRHKYSLADCQEILQ